MAELDDKLLKDINTTLDKMNQGLTTLEQTLSGVKSAMNAAFDPSVLREWSDAMRGMKAARIVDAESLKGVEEIKTVFNDISILRKEISAGKGFRLFSEDELNQTRTRLAEIQDMIALLNNMSKSGKLVDSDYAYLGELRAQRDVLKQQVANGGAFDVTLDEESMRRRLELMARYRQERQELSKSEQQRSVELANIKKKEEQAEESAIRTLMANVKRQIDIRTQLTRIEHERVERAKAGSKQTQEQIDAENRKYQALEETLRRLSNEAYVYSKNHGSVGGIAWQRMESYENYSNAKEDQRHLAQLQKIEEQQKKNTKETEKQNKALKDVEMTADRLKNALVAAFGIHQIKSFLSNMVKIRGEFEMSEVALRNIIGNSEKAQLIWKKTMNLAVNSPLTAQQLTKYTKQLAAFRIETSRLYDTTKMLADVSVGLGVDMERLILAYGHTKSSGFLRGMYARQFATAGVNIYGELADYYTKMEGQLVTFKDVYERISKKMVSFADVEKVFEKITSKGGTFYNMQQVLTDTVQGQINKIKDSWQQAMNDMGKSTQGTIRSLTNIVLNLVKNWRTWLSIIEGVTMAFVAFKAINISRALLSVSYAANTASKSTARLAAGLKNLFSFKGNGVSLIASSIIAIVTVFATMQKHMKDYNREIDEQTVTLYDAQQKMVEYQKRVEQNNNVIKDAASKEGELKFAREDNLNILSSLQAEYPELYKEVKQMANGEVVLTDKINAHNESLREQIRLNELLKQKNIFDDPFEKDTQQYFDKLGEWRKVIINTQQSLKLQMARGSLNKDEMPVVEALLGIDPNNILVAIDTYNNIISKIKSTISDRQKELEDAYTESIHALEEVPGSHSEIVGLQVEISKAWKKAIDDTGMKNLYKLSPIDTDVHAAREFKRESDEMIKEMLDSFELAVRSIDSEQKLITEEYDNNFASYFKKNGSRLLEMVKNNTVDVNETIRVFLEAHGQALTEENKRVWNILLNQAVFGVNKTNEIIQTAELAWAEKNPFMKRFFAKIAENQQDGMYDFFAEYKSPTPDDGDGDKDKQNKTYKSLEDILSLLKKMNSEYNKLSKSAYGFAKSNEVVLKNYKDAFDEILGEEAGGLVRWETLDITSKAGLEAAFKELEKSLNDKNLWGKYGKDVQKLQAKMKKAIADQGVEIEMDVQVRLREDFARQMDEAFKNYELTLELEKLNIPKDAIQGLFPDFEEETFGDLQRRMSDFYESQRDENGKVLFDEDDLKEYKKWAERLDTEILKSRKEKAKEYSKYLEKEYSERAKLEMQHAEDIAFVTANIEDDKRRATIISNINKKYQDDLNELNWKSFKESSFYVDMMDDIASLPAEYTKIMLDKINEILEHPETLSPRALKEAVNARQKVIQAQIATKPLSVMHNANKEIRAARKELKNEEDANLKWWKSTRIELDEQIKSESISIAKDEEKINSLKELQGELAAYEKLLKGVSDANDKVDMGGVNKLLGIEGSENVSELSDEDIKERINSLNELRESEKKLYDPSEKTDEQNARSVEIEQIEKLVYALNEELKAREALASYVISERVKDALEEGETSTSVGSQIAGVEEQKTTKQKKLTTWKEYRKQFKNFSDAFADFTKNHNDMINKIREMGNAWYDMFDALGGETNALTEGWKDFGNTMVDVFTKSMEMIPQMVVAFQSAGTSINAAMGIIGLIAEAVQLVFVAIGAVAKLKDSKYEYEIEKEQEKIDNLDRAYERLEKQIEKTWSTVSYIKTYREETQNLYEQYAALTNQINAEEAKKNTDKDKLQDYQDKQQEILDTLDEIKQQQIEVFGGIGENSYRSAAEGFVDAWKSAFLETGDGLQGLQDHFDEFLNDWFVKQATMRIAASNLEPLFRKIDDAVNQNGVGGANVTWQELKEINDLKDVLLAQTNEQLQQLAGVFGLGGEGSLSGLAAGIQGMTEEQANILEAYWNSVRMYSANIDMNVTRIAQILGAGGDNTNPMLSEMERVRENTDNIRNLLNMVSFSGGEGLGFRVYSF